MKNNTFWPNLTTTNFLAISARHFGLAYQAPTLRPDRHSHHRALRQSLRALLVAGSFGALVGVRPTPRSAVGRTKAWTKKRTRKPLIVQLTKTARLARR